MKIGVIGLGSIGMRHALNLKALGHEVSGYDPIKELRDQFPGHPYNADAYVFATPTSHHLGNFLDSALSYKPIFMEKPIANEWHPDLKCVDMVGYNLRFHSCTGWAKHWLEFIGKPLWTHFVCAQLNVKSSYLRDGVILNWSHEIDLALHLLGPAKVAASSTRLTDGKDDMTDILLTHDNGCRTTIHLDYIQNPRQRCFSIVGERGDIYANLETRFARHKKDGQVITYHHDRDGSFDEDYKREMSAFIQRCEGKPAAGCTGEEAMKVLKICLEVRRQAGL